LGLEKGAPGTIRYQESSVRKRVEKYPHIRSLSENSIGEFAVFGYPQPEEKQTGHRFPISPRLDSSIDFVYKYIKIF
jgi:hypothetical protein